MNLNPNNPVSRAANGNWHKITALVMHKLGVKKVEITEADVDAFVKSDCCNVGISDDKGHIEISLLNAEESAAALKKFGGRACDS